MKGAEFKRLKAVINPLIDGLNAALAMSPASEQPLMNLAHCIVHFDVKGLDTKVYFSVMKTAEPDDLASRKAAYSVCVVDPTDTPDDVVVSGSPLTYLKLFSQKDKASLFHTKALTLEGDSVRIQQLIVLINSVQVDWDGLLARFMGDIPAHLMGTSMRSSLSWGLNFSQALIRDTEEFIKYELRLLPDKRRTQKQFSAITDLANDLEALTQRINTLDANVNQ